MHFHKYIFKMTMLVGSLLLLSLPSWAQYREESGALEQIYEARVRAALNTILRPNEYSVVVAVDIDQDPQRLQEIETDLENMSLPGVPGLSMSENMPLSNKLHGLRNRVSVHLVLDDSISSEREKAARDLTMMKLHLDESNGDTLALSRAGLVPKDTTPKADLLPELSWRMWALVIIVSLLALGLALLLLNRRQKKDTPAPQIEIPAPTMDDSGSTTASSEAQPGEGEVSISATSATLIELYERKKSLISIAQKQPESSARAIESLFDTGHKQEVIRLMEALGWEESKELFHLVNHRCWAKIGSELVNQEKASKP